jgi:hypothetical protein
MDPAIVPDCVHARKVERAQRVDLPRLRRMRVPLEHARRAVSRHCHHCVVIDARGDHATERGMAKRVQRHVAGSNPRALLDRTRKSGNKYSFACFSL